MVPHPPERADDPVPALSTPDPSTVDAGPGARKRRRGPRGLGRGLARILIDSGGPVGTRPPGSGLSELVGAGPGSSRSVDLDRMVIEASLQALVTGFGLRALAVAAGPHPDGSGQPLTIRAVMPVGWSGDEGHGAMLHEHLRRITSVRRVSGPGRDSWSSESSADVHRLWSFQAMDEGRVVAAVALGTTFLPVGLAPALEAASRVVAFSLADRGVGPELRDVIGAGTLVSLKSEGSDVLAEVNADWPLPRPPRPGLRTRRTGVGRGPEPVLAIARAAAKASRPRCGLLYAASVEFEGRGLSLVLVRRESRSLCLGWADHRLGDPRGVAEAVFAAAM